MGKMRTQAKCASGLLLAGFGAALALGLSSCSNPDSPASPLFQTTPTKVPYTLAVTFSGAGSGASFSSPQAIAVDPSGNIFVADSGNNRVVKFTNGGSYVTQWFGGSVYTFSNPKGVAADGSGNIYVADSGNYTIQKFSNSGAWTTEWGGSGTGNGNFNGLSGLAVDRNAGYLYAVDANNLRVQKFNLAGAYQTQWGGSGTGNGQFNAYMGPVAVDSSGDVYVGDTNDNVYGYGRVQKFTSAGTFVSVLLSGSSYPLFYNPLGLAVDASGNQFIVDYVYVPIREYGPGDNFEDAINDGTGAGDNGVAVDAAGNIYAVSSATNLVYIFRKN